LYKNEKPIHGAEEVFVTEIFDRRSVRKGDWKILWSNPPWGEKGWELFNIAVDPGERNNLAKVNPEKAEELLNAWRDYGQRNGVITVDDYYMGWTNAMSHFKWLPPSMREDQEQSKSQDREK